MGIYAFDQQIDPIELNKLKQKRKRMRMGGQEKQSIIDETMMFIIDPLIGEWKPNELILRFVNDCRADIDEKKVTVEDERFYNVEYCGFKVNGWPQTYMIAKRDIDKGEMLMTSYGAAFPLALKTKNEEDLKKKERKERVDRDVLRGVEL